MYAQTQALRASDLRLNRIHREMSLESAYESLSVSASSLVDSVYASALSQHVSLSAAVKESPLGNAFGDFFARATPYVVRVPALEAAAKLLQDGASLHPTVSAMLISMILAYPLGLVLPSLPKGTVRHLWTLVTGVVLVQSVLGVDWLHVAIPSVLVYAILGVLRLLNLAKGLRHAIAAATVFGYLIFRHLARPNFSSNGIDDSAFVMVLVIKLYTLSYNLFDGDNEAALQKELKAASDDAARAAKAGDPAAESKAKFKARNVKEQLDRSVSALPNPLAFASLERSSA